MINKISFLTEPDQKAFYRKLADSLLDMFAMDEYETEEDLQEDFNEWRVSDLSDYRNCLDKILKDISPQGFELTWRDCKKIKKSRWKLCKVCNRPFLTTDKKNKMVYCYHTDYKRYKKGKINADGSYSEGYFFKDSGGTSQCYKISESKRVLRWLEHKKELEEFSNSNTFKP